MITVQTAMLVALGFLIASLLGLLIGSALWARAVRLTTTRLKQSMPVSEHEIRADRDRLRADFAVRVHKLETTLEQAKLERARQFIEINRRDASISMLEGSYSDVKAELEEHVNARRVLEQTVSDRLPRVEARLAEAKRLLFNRDREIAELTTGAKRHKLALEEASSITAQQSAQIEKLTDALTTKARVNGEERYESELGLRTEIETLRARSREQSALIDRLQQRLGQGFGSESTLVRDNEVSQQAREIDRLQGKLQDAEAALAGVRSATSETDAARIAFESEIRGLKSRTEDQAGEIARLKAAVETYDRLDGRTGSVKESKLVLKARLGSAQAHSDQQAATIGRLRAELASTHERLARQAAHFMDEIRRVSSEAPPSSAGPAQPMRRRTQRLADDSLAERVAQVRPASTEYSGRTGSVHDLASQIRRAQASMIASETTQAMAPEKTVRIEPAAPEHQHHGEAGEAALNGASNGNGTANGHALADGASANGANGAEPPLENGAVASASAELAAEMPKAPPIVEPRRRPRLLDRLSNFAKG